MREFYRSEETSEQIETSKLLADFFNAQGRMCCNVVRDIHSGEPVDSAMARQKAESLTREFEDDADERCNFLLEHVPSYEVDIRTDRVDKFFVGLELPTARHIITNSEGVEIAQQNDPAIDLPNTQGNERLLGKYLPLPHIIIMNLEAMSLTAPELEGTLVHEKTHGSGSIVLDYDMQKDHTYVCNGFKENDRGKTRGEFFEEGYASFIEAAYVDLNNMASAEAAHFIITDVPCPAKYGMGGMQRYFSVGSLAAIGIELLIGKDNGLHEAFLAARKDRQTLQEVKNRINALDAGLYEELSMLPRSRQGYVDGLSLIVERLYEGDLSAITRAPAEAGTREFFAQRLH